MNVNKDCIETVPNLLRHKSFALFSKNILDFKKY